MREPLSAVSPKGFRTRPARAFRIPGGDGATRPPSPGSEAASLNDPRDLEAALQTLGAREAVCRLEIGQLATVFLKRKLHRQLGFVRIGDYSRERLGMSGRELQSLAFVAERLEDLPATVEAYRRGEISWSHVRLLAMAATPGSEAEWLSRARRRSVSALARDIRVASGRGPDPGGKGRMPGGLLDDETGAIDGEPIARFRMPCPPRVAVLWRRAVGLARLAIGRQVPVWRAAEAIAAEGASALPPQEVPDPTPPADLPVVRMDTGAAMPFRRSGASLRGDAFDLDARMRALVRILQELDPAIGKLLHDCFELRIHRALGFSSFDELVRERAGVSPAKARALLAVERGARKAPELAKVYRGGEISWMRALTLLPVAGGEHDAAWVARAGEVTIRRLTDEVEWALDTRDAGKDASVPAPPPAGARLISPDLQICARRADEKTTAEVTFCGPASIIGFFNAVIDAFRVPGEPRWVTFERLLDHVDGEWRAQPRHRDPIFERDGWRCSVPGCSSLSNLHDHHVNPRSRGGDNRRSNRTATCVWHHLNGIHGGRIAASGEAPDGLTWELGLRPGRPPLMRLRGDSYVRP